MSDAVLENGVYHVTMTQSDDVPSSITSGGVLMVENELFDQMYVKEPSKSTKSSVSINIPNAIPLDDDKDQTDFHNQRHRSSSTIKLDTSTLKHDVESSACLRCSKKTKEYICNFAVVISLIVVVGLYSLGIVFFYTDVPENESFYDEALRNSLINQVELCLALVSHINNTNFQA